LVEGGAAFAGFDWAGKDERCEYGNLKHDRAGPLLLV
jgi:hypothetical protein